MKPIFTNSKKNIYNIAHHPEGQYLDKKEAEKC
jgi:hypothetical protein